MSCLVKIASIRSDGEPSKGQKHRSSHNFSTADAPSNCTGFYWKVSGTMHPEHVRFEVMEDKTGRDPTIFSSLGDGKRSKLIAKRNLYIANPNNGENGTFLISIYAEIPNGLRGYDTIKYNQVRAKASHNSYLRDESICDQLKIWNIRSIELDIHNGNDCGLWEKIDHNWYVYHASCVAENSSVRTFKDALDELVEFNRKCPGHEVITVAIDLKDSFDSLHTVDDLDRLIKEALGDHLYTPADFLGNNQYLQQSAGKWPLLKQLRGKFIFICTTGDLDSQNSHLNQYVSNGTRANDRICFVAPEISEEKQILEHHYAVFFNMKVKNSEKLGPAVNKKGFVSRGYGGNNESSWNMGIVGKNNLIGTDKVNTEKDPWATTEKVKRGWPFEGIDIAIDPKTV